MCESCACGASFVRPPHLALPTRPQEISEGDALEGDSLSSVSTSEMLLLLKVTTEQHSRLCTLGLSVLPTRHDVPFAYTLSPPRRAGSEAARGRSHSGSRRALGLPSVTVLPNDWRPCDISALAHGRRTDEANRALPPFPTAAGDSRRRQTDGGARRSGDERRHARRALRPRDSD